MKIIIGRDNHSLLKLLEYIIEEPIKSDDLANVFDSIVAFNIDNNLAPIVY